MITNSKTFIYEKSNSLTHELCDDVINIYKKCDNVIEPYNIDYDQNFTKIKLHLIKELRIDLIKYKKIINSIVPNYSILKNESVYLSFYIENRRKKKRSIV